MIWKDFQSEFRYKYLRLLVKSLSSAEQYYLKSLRDGVEEQINSSIDWVIANKDLLYDFKDYQEWIDYYYDDSELERILITLLDNNVNRNIKPLYEYYISGGNLAYAHMDKDPLFQDSDVESLSILSDYVSSVIRSINGELNHGIVDVIGKSINDEDIENLTDNINDLWGNPIHTNTDKEGNVLVDGYDVIDSKFSIDTRCLFTTKTEYARAVNTGLLQAYSNYGVDLYDWITMDLPTTCDRCYELEANGPYTLNEIINFCPVHVNCCCSVKGRFNNNLSLDDNPKIIDLTHVRK